MKRAKIKSKDIYYANLKARFPNHQLNDRRTTLKLPGATKYSVNTAGLAPAIWRKFSIYCVWYHLTTVPSTAHRILHNLFT